MNIGIISDTHDQIGRAQKAVDLFNLENVGTVIHCGDIVSPFMHMFFKELRCPVKFLLGNNTGDVLLHLQQAEAVGLKECAFGTFFSLVLSGRRIAVYHGDHKEITDALIKCGDYDCVFAGHDHISRVVFQGDVLFVNPGTLADRHKEGMTPPSIAIYDTDTHTARIIEIIDSQR